MAYVAYKFAQYVGFLVPGKDLVLKLDPNWSKVRARKGSTLVIVPQTIRREMGMMHTPLSFTVGVNDERLQAVLARNSVTVAAHKAKFDLQAEKAKESKQGRELLKLIASLLAE